MLLSDGHKSYARRRNRITHIRINGHGRGYLHFNNGLLNFQKNWADSSGEDNSESFAGIPNGKPIQLRESGLVDSLVLYFERPNCLVSEAKREELSIMKAAREISNDGKTLTITQTVHVLTDQSYVNETVYKKEDFNPF